MCKLSTRCKSCDSKDVGVHYRYNFYSLATGLFLRLNFQTENTEAVFFFFFS